MQSPPLLFLLSPRLISVEGGKSGRKVQPSLPPAPPPPQNRTTDADATDDDDDATDVDATDDDDDEDDADAVEAVFIPHLEGREGRKEQTWWGGQNNERKEKRG